MIGSEAIGVMETLLKYGWAAMAGLLGLVWKMLDGRITKVEVKTHTNRELLDQHKMNSLAVFATKEDVRNDVADLKQDMKEGFAGIHARLDKMEK